MMPPAYELGERIMWIDPRAPNQGLQVALVRDVAGVWLLVEPEYGARAGKRYWVRATKVNSSRPHDPERFKRIVEEVVKIAQGKGAPEDHPGLCMVCRGALRGVHRKDAKHSSRHVRLQNWLYCDACDRMQRTET